VSVVSSLSTQLAGDGDADDLIARTDRQPFVAYRINDGNLAKIEALFHPEQSSSGGSQLAAQLSAALPQHELMSHFGFSQFRKTRAADMGFQSQLRDLRADLQQRRRPQHNGGDNDIDDSDQESSSSSSSDDQFRNVSDNENNDNDNDDDSSSVVSSLSSGSRSQSMSARSLSRSNSLKQQHQYSHGSVRSTPRHSKARHSGTESGSGQGNLFLALHGGDQGAYFAQSLLNESLSPDHHRHQPHHRHHSGRGHSNSNSRSEAMGDRKRPQTITPMGSPFRLGKLQRVDDHDHDNVDDKDNYTDNHSLSMSQASVAQRSVSSAPFRAVQQLRRAEVSSSAPEPSTAYESWISQYKTRRSDNRLGEFSTQLAPLIVSQKPQQKFSDSFAGVAAATTAVPSRSANSQTMLVSFAPSKSASVSARPNTAIADFMRDLDPLSLNVQSTVIGSGPRLSEGVHQDVEDLYDDDEVWDSSDDDHEHTGRGNDGQRSKSVRKSLSTSLLVGERVYNNESDNDHDHEEAGEGLGGESSTNPFVVQRHMRMRAEKLIDHKFVQALFLKKTTFVQSQDLIHRMEQLLALLDSNQTGYISFEQFTRLILAIAPKHLLRADVEKFFNAQTDRPEDLVDYREFVISGKVLLLTKAQLLQKNREHAKEEEAKREKERLRMVSGQQQRDASTAFAHRSETSTTAVWLKRQREYVGNPSTYTWKQHLKWYSTRKAQAVIWLVRRATRAFDHEKQLLEAQRFLSHTLRRQALAMTDLMNYGHAALFAKEKRMVAKRRLLTRVIRARKHIQHVQAAHFFLVMTAKGAKKEAEYIYKFQAMREQSKRDRVEKMTAVEQDEENLLFHLHVSAPLAKKKQANYGNLFKVKELQRLAILFLKAKGSFAKEVTERQQESLQGLQQFAHRVLKQCIAQERAQRQLVQRAELSLSFCIAQDQAWLFLLRRGDRAVNLGIRKEKAQEWLRDKATTTISFLASQSTTWIELYEIGKKTLARMNERESAFARLCQRREKAQRLVLVLEEAFQFLRQAPQRLFRVYDEMDKASHWLEARAQQAKQHALKQGIALNYLQVMLHD
jgi:hypothetical protein